MLTIDEESGKYKGGNIPNLEDDGDAFAYVWKKLEELGIPSPADVIQRLSDWSCDKAPHGYPTWLEAVKATALANQLANQQSTSEKAQFNEGIGQVARTADEVLTNSIGLQGSDMVKALPFANCGKTAATVLDLLQPRFPGSKEHGIRSLKELRIAQEKAPTYFGPVNCQDLRGPLSALPGRGKVLFVDCSFREMHTFLIEVHPDGRRYLMQGYQGVYLASWWQGTDPNGLALTKPEKETVEKVATLSASFRKTEGMSERTFETDLEKYNAALEALTAVRSKYGLGQPITPEAMEAFVNNLIAAFAGGTTECFAAYWMSLPLCPTLDQSTMIKNLQAIPQIQVGVYEVDYASTGADSIGATVIPALVSDKVKIAK
jgi:hypothetical protein